MSPPLKCSKSSEAVEKDNTDRISSLPDELLSYMLSFLPTKCAVGTSILSSRWRCLHMLTDCLSFYVPYGNGEEMGIAQKTSFMNFVYRVLLFHKVSPIKKFHLHCGLHTYGGDTHIRNWISAAILKGVEQLHLYFPGQPNVLPLSLFSCKSIVELKIRSNITNFRFPESIQMPNLKILDLYDFEFSDTESFGKFVCACSVLQELYVNHCGWPMDSDRHVYITSTALKRLGIRFCKGKFVVDAPNVAFLQYTCIDGADVALSLMNSDSLVTLVTASLEFSFTHNSNAVQLGIALIKAVHHVRELHLLTDVVQYLTLFDDDRIPSYPNLVKFHIGHCSYDTWKYITHWLANSPRLEKLVFEQKLIRNTERDEKWPSNVALVPFSSGVKVIEGCRFRGYSTELALVKYLLRNAKLLKRLILYKDPYEMNTQQELQASRKLLKLPRASRTCVIQLKKYNIPS